MVEPVERLYAESEAVALLDDEVLEEAQIVVLEARVVEHVAQTRRHDRAVGRFREDRRAVRVGDPEPEVGIGGANHSELLIAVLELRVAIELPVLRSAARADAGEVIARSDAEGRA